MAHPLDESDAKINWAEKHIRSLNTKVASWLDEMEAKGEMGRLRFEYDPQTGWLESFIDYIPEPPPYRFGLIVGDIVHSLRSALDHLAWELANLHSPNRGEDHSTQFPITLSDKKWAEGRVQKMMKHMDPAHAELIKDEQPWVVNPQGSEASHPLAVLGELSNRDKHQGIHPVAFTQEFFYVYPTVIRDCSITDVTTYGVELKLNAKLMRMRVVVTGPDPQMDVNGPILPPTVQIQHGDSIGRVDFVTRNIAGLTRGIIDRFRRRVFP